MNLWMFIMMNTDFIRETHRPGETASIPCLLYLKMSAMIDSQIVIHLMVPGPRYIKLSWNLAHLELDNAEDASWHDIDPTKIDPLYQHQSIGNW